MKIALPPVGIQNRYKLISVHPETLEETELTGWFGNKILTTGRNEMAKRNWFTAVQVGTDSTPPSESNTSMLGYVAGTSNIEESVSGAQATADFYGWKRNRFRFPLGSISVNQNLNEVGIGWDTADGDNLATRALIVDINGDQTTVTWKADEYLDVVVEVRYYPPLVDATGTVTINGVVYNYIMRAANVTSSSAWALGIGSKIESTANGVSDWSVYDDDIGTIEQGPSGVATASDNDNDYTNAYAENSYQITYGMNVGPSGWNSLTGKLLRSLLVKTTAGHYQIQFDNGGNGVPKTDQFTMTTDFILGWTERGIT